MPPAGGWAPALSELKNAMLTKQDFYAKGMVEVGDEHLDLTPELDLFQYRMIKPYLGCEILEVGAGPGRIARVLTKDSSTSYNRFVVSEPSEYFFEKLKKRPEIVAKAILVRGETSHLLKLYSEGFDTIFSVHVLEHIEDDRQFLEDCFLMLKPGGRLVTLVPALQFLYSELDRNIGHFRRYDKTMVRRLLQGTGFELITMYYTNFLAIIPSLLFFKMRKLDYQKNESNKRQFFFLEKIYSKYFIPLTDLMERYLPVPIGLNLTFVLQKPVERALLKNENENRR